MGRLARRIEDKRLLGLIRRYLPARDDRVGRLQRIARELDEAGVGLAQAVERLLGDRGGLGVVFLASSASSATA
jgi:hypothetical protein